MARRPWPTSWRGHPVSVVKWESLGRTEESGGEAGIRTLGRTLKALQRFSKPPPSASRPPHRARKLSIYDITTYEAAIVPTTVPEIVAASSQSQSAKTAPACVRRADLNAPVLFVES